MAAKGQPDARPRRALLVVRNTFEHDARVLRAASKLAELGLEPTVVAALRPNGSGTPHERNGPVWIVRVGPRSTLARRALGRVRGRLTRRAGTANAPAPAPRRGPGTGRIVRRLGRLALALDFNLRAIAEARRLAPDLVQCNDHNTMWVGVISRLLLGSAVVYDSHELWPDRNLRPEARPWLIATEALFVRVAHRVVMTSPAHAEVLARRYRVPPPTVVRNIPDAGAASPEQLRPEGLNGSAPVAVYVGGLLRNRGLEQSIRALPLTERPVRLRLLGPVSDEYRAELERLALDAGVADRLEFAPPVPPAEVVAALASADVGLALFQPTCLSHRLVLPNKLFEYARAGLPVVGSDLPMIHRFVHEHELGATVDAEDPGAIAAALTDVLSDKRREGLRAAARRAGSTLDWSAEGEILAQVYRDALARAGGA